GQRSQRGGEINRIELSESIVMRKRLVQVSENAVVINDVAEVLSLVFAIYAGNSLQEGVVRKFLVDVEHRVYRCVESSQEFTDNDDDLRITISLEPAGEAFVVALLRSKPRHHLAPECLHTGEFALCAILVIVPVIRAGDQNLD